jgi:hypothetical protein
VTRSTGLLGRSPGKKLGRISVGIGDRITGHRKSQAANRRARRRGAAQAWEFVHVAVDDATRLAYAEGPFGFVGAPDGRGVEVASANSGAFAGVCGGLRSS